MKKCSGCREILFVPMATQYMVDHGGYCRECKKKRNSAAYRANPEYWAEWYKDYLGDGPRLPTGCTMARYEQIMVDQGYVCGGCECDFTDDVHPNVDHDHRCCGVRRMCAKCIRGILCMQCNCHLGRMNEDPARLPAGLVAYLNRHAQKS